jgi:hypothetical protein
MVSITALPAAALAEIVRLYGLRNWVEQSYKQTRQSLGWSQYQVRSDLAIRRHWQLVCCAFSFCWYHHRHSSGETAPFVGDGAEQPAECPASEQDEGRGENQGQTVLPTACLLAGGAATGASVAGALDHAVALLARVVESAPAAGTPAAA